MKQASKTPDLLKYLKLSHERERREGIAIVDVDPTSSSFSRLMVDIPLDPTELARHIFYDRTMMKTCVDWHPITQPRPM